MKVTMRELINYEWNNVKLWGISSDESTWHWDTEQRYKEEVLLADALDIVSSSTPYDSLGWEMETEEGDPGYNEEVEARESFEAETYDVRLPNEPHRQGGREHAESFSGESCSPDGIEFGTRYVDGKQDYTEYFVTARCRHIAIDYDHVSGKYTAREFEN